MRPVPLHVRQLLPAVTMDRWAYYTWYWLHGIVRVAPHERLVELITMLPAFLPCIVCGLHMRTYIDINTPVATEQWVMDFHNSVNKRLNKPHWSGPKPVIPTWLALQDAWLQWLLASVATADWSVPETARRYRDFICLGAIVNRLPHSLIYFETRRDCLAYLFTMYGRWLRYRTLADMIVDTVPPSEYQSLDLSDPLRCWQSAFERRMAMVQQYKTSIA